MLKHEPCGASFRWRLKSQSVSFPSREKITVCDYGMTTTSQPAIRAPNHQAPGRMDGLPDVGNRFASVDHAALNQRGAKRGEAALIDRLQDVQAIIIGCAVNVIFRHEAGDVTACPRACVVIWAVRD